MSEKEKIIVFSSREICYQSSSFFANQMADAFENLGFDVQVCEFDEHDDLDAVFQPLYGQKYRLLLDFNSTITRMVEEDGTPVLDKLDGPFFDYILDHPLFHYNCLNADLKNLNGIFLDEAQEAYVKRYYPRVKKTLTMPLGATEAVTGGKKTETDTVLFMGTYDRPDKIYEMVDLSPEPLRSYMKELIEIHGGRNLAAVSANVDYIVAGENMGPAKLKKAEKLGVKIISEEEFIAMVGGQEAPAANGTEADGATTANNGGRNNGAPAAARKAGPEGDGAMPHSAGRKTPEPAATADDAGAPGKGTVDKPEKDTAGKPGENTADKPGKDAAGKPGEDTADKPAKDAAGKPGKSKPEIPSRGKQVKPSGKKGAEAAATEGGDGEPVQQGELF